MDIAEELQSQAGSLPNMNNILLETASESDERRADAVFTGMKRVLGQTSAIFREKIHLQKTPVGKTDHRHRSPKNPGDEQREIDQQANVPKLKPITTTIKMDEGWRAREQREINQQAYVPKLKPITTTTTTTTTTITTTTPRP